MMQRLTIPNFFLIIALLFGTAYIAITSPFIGVDETRHFLRIYDLSQGKNFASETELPVNLIKFTADFYRNCASENFYKSSECADRWSIPLYDGEFMTVPTARASAYSAIAYLPAVFATTISKAIGISPLGLFYLIKAALFYTAIGMIYLALRITPAFSHQMAFATVLPGLLFILTTISADAMTIAYSFLFFAFILKKKQEEKLLNMKDVAIITVLAICIPMSKVLYFPILSLSLLLIGKKYFVSVRANAAFYVCSILLPFIISVAWIMSVPPLVTTEYPSFSQEQLRNAPYLRDFSKFVYNDPADIGLDVRPEEQKQFLQDKIYPLVTLPVFTFVKDFYKYIVDVTTSISFQYYFPFIAFIPLLTIVMFSPRTFAVETWQRVIFLLGFWAFYSVMTLFMYIVFTPVGDWVTKGMQGRYLIPVLPLLVLAFASRRAVADTLIGRKIQFSIAIFFNMACFIMFYLYRGEILILGDD